MGRWEGERPSAPTPRSRKDGWDSTRKRVRMRGEEGDRKGVPEIRLRKTPGRAAELRNPQRPHCERSACIGKCPPPSECEPERLDTRSLDRRKRVRSSTTESSCCKLCPRRSNQRQRHRKPEGLRVPKTLEEVVYGALSLIRTQEEAHA